MFMRRKFLLVLAVMLVASLSALGQGTDKVGYIYCAHGQYVYLYDSLNTFNVLANLKCGARVGVLGSENGYVIVRTADEKQGYVPAAAITSTPPANAPQARASANGGSAQGGPVEMSSSPNGGSAQGGPVEMSSSPNGGSAQGGPVDMSGSPNGGSAQGGPVDVSGSPVGTLEPAHPLTRADIFGGYSYLNLDTNGVTSRQNFNGWEASVAAHAYKWLALEGGVGGYYKTYSYNLGLLGNLKVSVHDYNFMGGPRVNYGRAFFHGLVGIDHLASSALGSSASENSLAAAFGGGAQWRIARDWSVRTSADYLLTRHTSGLSRVMQNNIRVSAGVVYTVRARSE